MNRWSAVDEGARQRLQSQSLVKAAREVLAAHGPREDIHQDGQEDKVAPQPNSCVMRR